MQVMKIIRVYRFQGTKEIETNSYFEDVMDIWYQKEMYLEDLDETESIPSEVLDEWFKEKRFSLSFRTSIDARTLFDKIIACQTEDEAWQLAQTYKMDGVFAIDADKWDEEYSIEELIQTSVHPQLGLKNQYLIEANEELVEDFGEEYGLLVHIQEILHIYETPKEFIK